MDEYPESTMKQIVALDRILNVTTTPDVQLRNRKPVKYDTSPYIQLSKDKKSSRRVLIFFRVKHPFESHNDFEVKVELIASSTNGFSKMFHLDVSSIHVYKVFF